MFVLVAYDVEARRTSKLRKALSRFLGHEQNSVFFGDISESGLKQLRAAISQVSEPGDRILEISAANRNNVRVCTLEKHPGNGALQEREDTRHVSNAAVL